MTPPQNRNLLGALWMLASAGSFTFMTILIKAMPQYPAALQAFYAAVASFLVMLPIVLRSPRKAFATDRPWLMFARSASSAAGVTLAYYSYKVIPLAQANALAFTRSLWIAPLAAILLHEKIGRAKVLALLVGFAGVLLAVQPNSEAPLGWGHAAALGGAMLIAFTATGIKALTRTNSATVIMCWSSVLGVVLTAPGAILTWRWPDPHDFGLLMLTGFSSVVTQICYVRGMSMGDASAMATVDYSRLVMAVAVGIVLFHETPSLAVYLGMALIVLSSTAVALRGRTSAPDQISPP